jgi:hypothetical protein
VIKGLTAVRNGIWIPRASTSLRGSHHVRAFGVRKQLMDIVAG